MDVKDWADQDEILQVMNNIYNNADFNQVVSAIDDTIASFINGEEDDTAEERNQTEENVLSNAFQVFTKQHQLQEGLYKMSSKTVIYYARVPLTGRKIWHTETEVVVKQLCDYVV